MPNPWTEFESCDYRIEDLGRPAIFLIPARKLDWQYMNGRIRDHLHAFLIEHIGAFTTALIPQFGVWTSAGDRIIYDECCQYEVSFVGKERISLLMRKLAMLARQIEEECIYFKAGEDACLIYPSKT